MTDLYHYTCRHAADEINGFLIPNPQPFLQGYPLVWLTDLEVADADILGLTSHTLTCDRTEYQYRVTDPFVGQPWLGSWIQSQTPAFTQQALHEGRKPEHWFIASVPVPVERIGEKL